MEIVTWFQTNWIAICAALWSIDQLLKIVAPLTPWTFDDNLADMFGKFLARFVPKR